jgi:uncharacterized ion transporter superfamily protein YfcC
MNNVGATLDVEVFLMVPGGFLNSKKSVLEKAPSIVFNVYHLIRRTDVLLRQSAEILCCPILFCVTVHQIRRTCFSFYHKLFLGICEICASIAFGFKHKGKG